jgi:hypothetical protein
VFCQRSGKTPNHIGVENYCPCSEPSVTNKDSDHVTNRRMMIKDKLSNILVQIT